MRSPIQRRKDTLLLRCSSCSRSYQHLLRLVISDTTKHRSLVPYGEDRTRNCLGRSRPISCARRTCFPFLVERLLVMQAGLRGRRGPFHPRRDSSPRALCTPRSLNPHRRRRRALSAEMVLPTRVPIVRDCKATVEERTIGTGPL